MLTVLSQSHDTWMGSLVVLGIPVHLKHKHLSVIAMCDPSCGSVRFFVMVGYPFGMTASVMNYCPKSHALNQFFIRCLRIASMSFFDNKFCFLPG